MFFIWFFLRFFSTYLSLLILFAWKNRLASSHRTHRTCLCNWNCYWHPEGTPIYLRSCYWLPNVSSKTKRQWIWLLGSQIKNPYSEIRVCVHFLFLQSRRVSLVLDFCRIWECSLMMTLFRLIVVKGPYTSASALCLMCAFFSFVWILRNNGMVLVQLQSCLISSTLSIQSITNLLRNGDSLWKNEVLVFTFAEVAYLHLVEISATFTYLL